MAIHFFDAREHLEEEALGAMLAAAGDLDDDMLEATLERYAGQERARLIGALDEQGELLGLLGIEMAPDVSGTILHLYVHPAARRRGVGGGLLRAAISMLTPLRIDARCAEDRVPFFERVGFSSRIVGAVPPGRLLYGVRWERPMPGGGAGDDHGDEDGDGDR